MRGVKSAAIAFSTILIFLAFMISIIVLCSPNLVNPHYTIALLTIKPVTGAGPSIYFGLLGSCSRNTFLNDPVVCKNSPQYDLSILPPSLANLVVDAPPTALLVMTCMFVVLEFLYFALFLAMTIRGWLGHRVQAAQDFLEHPWVISAVILVGILVTSCCAFGFTIMKMWYSQTRQNFNEILQYESQNFGQGPELVAKSGLGFTLIWVFFTLCVLPIGVSAMEFPILNPRGGNAVRLGNIMLHNIIGTANEVLAATLGANIGAYIDANIEAFRQNLERRRGGW